MSLRVKLLMSSTVIISMLVFLLIPPVAQWSEYHQFADKRLIFGVPEFLNVLSSVLYILTGAFSLIFLRKAKIGTNNLSYHLPTLIFFIGLVFTGFGSIIYHLNPTNETLFWDRLPMTICFMSFFSFVIMTCIDKKWGQRLFFPLLIIGIFSVAYWHYTESIGQGDLRLYGLVQFLPMLLIPIILATSHCPERKYLWGVVFIYVIAKLCEALDHQLLELFYVSGHTLKHVISAFTANILLLSVLQAAYPVNKQKTMQ